MSTPPNHPSRMLLRNIEAMIVIIYLILPAVTPLVSDLWKSTKKIMQGMIPSSAAEL